MNWYEEFQKYLQSTSHFWVSNEAERYAYLTDKERQSAKRKKESLKDRKAVIVKTNISGQILNVHRFESQQTIDYLLYLQHFIKQEGHFFLEEAIEYRMAQFEDGKLVVDEIISQEGNATGICQQMNMPGETVRRPFYYQRFEAVRYAEKWWNSQNPNYKGFDVDCTNYVSQCLFAGGAPMNGQPNRAKGWWYQHGKPVNWSFSWTVANALRWFLSGSTSGLRAKEMSSADQLKPGDVICYDFEGDGRFDHNTIVTAKDANRMPLVNAHSTDCRMRYWEYEDSTAWTPNIKYKFFHIVDDG